MSPIPGDFGAHGAAPSFSGSNGSTATKREGDFANMGSREGGPSPMPDSARAGAFQCDESCQEYTGNPRDGAGPLGAPAGTNKVPSAGLTRSKDS